MPKKKTKRKLEFVAVAVAVDVVLVVVLSLLLTLSTNNQVVCSRLSHRAGRSAEPSVQIQPTTQSQETQTQASDILAQTVKYEIQNVSLASEQEFTLTTLLQADGSSTPGPQTTIVSPPVDQPAGSEELASSQQSTPVDSMGPPTLAPQPATESAMVTLAAATSDLIDSASNCSGSTNSQNASNYLLTTQATASELASPQSPSMLLIDKDQSTWGALPTIKPNVSRWVLAWNQLTNGESDYYGGYPIYKVASGESNNATTIETHSESRNQSTPIVTFAPPVNATLTPSINSNLSSSSSSNNNNNNNNNKTTTTTTKRPATSWSSTRKTTPKTIVENEFVNMLHIATTTTTTQRPYVAKRDCGVRPMKREGRVVGGRDSHLGEFPWSVLIRETSLMGFFVKTKCGGVLIDLKWVLTAAHCQPGMFGSLVVVVGEYDLVGNADKLKPIVRKVKRMIVHRDYNPSNFDNDIALLELESPYQIQPHVVPICLPDKEEEFIGQPAMVAGWGKLSFGGPVPSVLQVAKLPVIGNKQCQEMYHNSGHMKIISDSFLCAGYENGGQDSCEGDSGGPLQTQRLVDGRWVLVGTVSHGIKCAEPNLPGIYIRTTAYLPWIRAVMYHQDTNKRYGHRRQILFS